MNFDRNGAYSLTLVGTITGNTYQKSDFTVLMRPGAPTGLSATSSGGNVLVQWDRGSEPDLQSYSISVGGRNKSGSVGTFCASSQCTATVPASGSGTAAVQVTAYRSGGTSASSSTSVNFGSGGGGGGGGGTNSPNLPGGGSNVPLTSGAGNSQYSLPNVAPQGASQNFAYPTPQPQVAPNQLYRKQSMTTAESQALQWGKSVAIALILLVCAAHLGTWTRRLRTAQAGGASRASRLGRARVSVAKARIAQAEAMAKAGILDKEAIVGEDAAEEKTKKGLLRRRRKGIDQAGVVSTFHAEGDAALVGDDAAHAEDAADDFGAEGAEYEQGEYREYDEDEYGSESYYEEDESENGFYEDGSPLYAEEGEPVHEGEPAAGSSHDELDGYGSHWQADSPVTDLESHELVDFDVIPSPRPSEPQQVTADSVKERRAVFGRGTRGRRRKAR
jgi:hypothetical protein